MRTANKFYTSPNSVICRIVNISYISKIYTDRSYPYFYIYMNSKHEHVIYIPSKNNTHELDLLTNERNKLIKLLNK